MITAEQLDTAVRGIKLSGGKTQIEEATIEEVGCGSSILTIQGVFSKEDCRQILQFYRDNQGCASPGQVGAGYNPNLKSCKDLLISADTALDALLLNRVTRSLKMVEKIVPGFFGGPYGDTGYRIQHYPPGGYYHWHVDHSSNRRLSLLLYLNDVEDGGETEFWYQDVKVTPEAGKLLVFPTAANYTHRGRPSSFDKYIVTSFVVDR